MKSQNSNTHDSSEAARNSAKRELDLTSIINECTKPF